MFSSLIWRISVYSLVALASLFFVTRFAVGQTTSIPPNFVPNGGGLNPYGTSGDFGPLQPLTELPPDFRGDDFNNFPGQRGSYASSLGANRGSFSTAPTIFGDFFGGGFSAFGGSQRVTRSFTAPGVLLSATQNTILGFEVGDDSIPNDVFTTGLPSDLSGDGNPDSFGILEPLPTSDAPTSPGQGFVFDPDSGRAVYVGNSGGQTAINGIFTNGQNWFVSYDYVASLTGTDVDPIVPVPGPGVSARRVKVSENFSADVRNRLFLNYSFFNDAYGGLGDINRYVLGFERIVFEDLISIEARLPIAATYGSTQTIGLDENRNIELGNAAIIGKGVLLATEQYIWSAGVGVGLPLADDTVLRRDNRDVLQVQNRSVHLFPFTSLLFRYDQYWTLQGVTQLDVALNGDPIRGDLTGASLPKIGTFNDSTLLHLDFAATRSVYRNPCGSHLRELLFNGELHYTGTLQESDFVSSGGITYTNLAKNFNILNATVGAHFVLADNLIVSPAISVPLRDGLDEQFDYEAQVQVNYLP